MRSWVVGLGLWLVPAVGWGQTARPPWQPPPATVDRERPPDAETAPPLRTRELRPGRGTRILGEVLGGAVGTIAGAGVGFVGAFVLAGLDSDRFDVTGDNAGALFLGGGFGLAGGIVTGGDLNGGTGTFGYTFLGTLVGFGLLIPVAAALDDARADELILPFAFLLPLAGGIVGYELSDHGPAPRVASRPAARRGVQLLGAGAVPTQGGLTVSGALRF